MHDGKGRVMVQIQDKPLDPRETLEPGELEQRRRFLRLDDSDLKNLQDVREVAVASSSDVVERFYDHLLSNEVTRAYFQSEKHIETVKRTQARYFSELFVGVCDKEYFDNRLRVGRAHERIGLGPQWYIGAYCLYMNELLPIILSHYRDNLQQGI